MIVNHTLEINSIALPDYNLYNLTRVTVHAHVSKMACQQYYNFVCIAFSIYFMVMCMHISTIAIVFHSKTTYLLLVLQNLMYNFHLLDQFAVSWQGDPQNPCNWTSENTQRKIKNQIDWIFKWFLFYLHRNWLNMNYLSLSIYDMNL